MSSEVRKLTESGAQSDWAGSAMDEARKLQGPQSNIPAKVMERVKEARSAWCKVLFPTPKLEAWKYTNTDPIARGPFVLAATCKPSKDNELEVAQLLDRALIKGFERTSQIVFVDGVFSARHSKLVSEPGVAVSRLLEGAGGSENIGNLGQHSQDAFSALATALLSDCVSISVSPGYEAQVPFQIVHITTTAAVDTVSTPRIRVDAGDNSRVTIVESHIGATGIRYLSLPIVELAAEAGACIDYYKIQLESEQAFYVAGVTAIQSRDAHIRTHLFSFGGALVRNNAQALLNGSGSQALLNGLSVLSGSQHVDNATLIHHIEPNAESREHFKGIYRDSSKGVFSGTITVEKRAQKTNAFQSNQALLLSPDASIESRPQLKIWADDVKCTHGATVGQLDADALFYLRSRGIGEQEAKAFLVHAFAVLNSVNAEPVKVRIEQLISEKLEAKS
jgi:Fe-S cluster assembly protein SufD